jgi:hypothetical protein
VTGNRIHDIHVRRLFSGAEMAGIKFHAAIDCRIEGNHIYRTCRGLWLDWMAQGTRVSRNLFHDNLAEDLFVEVNHGPFLVDNNIFLSPTTLLDVSEGAAYAHNLIAGRIISGEEPNRETPYHPAHSTVVAGLKHIKGGDDRFYNNVFVGKGPTGDGPPKPGGWHRGLADHGLWVYDPREYPLQTGGNVYYHGARPYKNETGAAVREDFDPQIRLQGDSLAMTLDQAFREARTALVTTQVLGLAKISGVRYENADGSPIQVDVDYLGKPRDRARPTPGPFENPGEGAVTLKLR